VRDADAVAYDALVARRIVARRIIDYHLGLVILRIIREERTRIPRSVDPLGHDGGSSTDNQATPAYGIGRVGVLRMIGRQACGSEHPVLDEQGTYENYTDQ
jgi:hypothetical protein